MTTSDHLAGIATSYGEYPVAAYAFVADALKEVCCEGREDCACEGQVGAAALVDGVLDLAARRFGLLGGLVLRSWKLETSSDVGRVTYHLIDHGIFGKQADDVQADFHQGPDFSRSLRERVIASL